MNKFITLILALVSFTSIHAQKVGVMTDDPKSVLHVFSSGQIPHPDGLLMLGHPNEAHMRGDFNYFQSKYGLNEIPINLYLQPDGGNVGIKMPFSTYPFAPLHVHGTGTDLSTHGLLMLGSSLAGHLKIDYDRIQSGNGADPNKLQLQPDGGDVELAAGTMIIDQSKGTVGIGDATPDASLDIISSGNTSATRALQIRSSTYGNLFNVRDDGNVGIGTSAPNYDLHVIGEIGVSSKVVRSNDNDTYMHLLSDKIAFYAGGKEMIDMTENDSQDILYLGDGSDIDIRMNLSDLHVDGASGYVGIGTSTPDTKLDVNGDLTITGHIRHHLDGDTYQQFLTDRYRIITGNRVMLDAVEGDVDYVNIADGTMYVNHTEDAVGIGTSQPQTELHVVHGLAGGISLENNLDNLWTIHNDVPTNNLYLMYNGNYRGSFDDIDGDYVSTSDRRVKKNIEDMGPVLEKVNQLSPKTYQFKTQKDNEEHSIGFIAQEVLEVFPETVSYNEGKDLYGLDYNDFAVISIQAIQELTDIVKEQQKQIDELKAELAGSKAD